MIRLIAILLVSALTASAQVWTNATPPTNGSGSTNGTVAPPIWWQTMTFTGDVAGVWTNLQLQGGVVGTTNLSAAARATFVSNGSITINGTLLTNGAVITVTSTNGGGSGTLSGAYSTSALLALAVSGTNIVGGLSSAVATGGQWNASVAAVGLLSSGSVQRAGDTMTGILTNTIGIQVGLTNDSMRITRTRITGPQNIAGYLELANDEAALFFGDGTVQFNLSLDNGNSTFTFNTNEITSTHALRWGGYHYGDGSGLTNLPTSGVGATNLSSLSDVTTAGVRQGEPLTWDANVSKFVPGQSLVGYVSCVTTSNAAYTNGQQVAWLVNRDDFGWYSTNTQAYTPRQAGTYMVCGNSAWSVVTASYSGLALYLNGSLVSFLGRNYGDTAANTITEGTAFVYCNGTNDALSVRASFAAATAVTNTLVGSPLTTEINIYRIGQ